jgi:hypothetical protein
MFLTSSQSGASVPPQNLNFIPCSLGQARAQRSVLASLRNGNICQKFVVDDFWQLLSNHFQSSPFARRHRRQSTPRSARRAHKSDSLHTRGMATSADVSALLAVLLPGCEDSAESRRALALKLRAAADTLTSAEAINAPGRDGGSGVVPRVAAAAGGGMPEGKAPVAKQSVGAKRDAPTSPSVSAPPSSAKTDDNNNKGNGTSNHATKPGTGNKKPYNTRKPAKVQKAFDFSRYPTRHVALHVMYAGWNYHGGAAQVESSLKAPVSTLEPEMYA